MSSRSCRPLSRGHCRPRVLGFEQSPDESFPLIYEMLKIGRDDMRVESYVFSYMVWQRKCVDWNFDNKNAIFLSVRYTVRNRLVPC